MRRAFAKSSREGFTKGIIEAINELVKLLVLAVMAALLGILYAPIFILPLGLFAPMHLVVTNCAKGFQVVFSIGAAFGVLMNMMYL